MKDQSSILASEIELFQNVGSCASRKGKLNVFKQNSNLLKAENQAIIGLNAQFFLSSGTSMGILCVSSIEGKDFQSLKIIRDLPPSLKTLETSNKEHP